MCVGRKVELFLFANKITILATTGLGLIYSPGRKNIETTTNVQRCQSWTDTILDQSSHLYKGHMDIHIILS